MKKVDDIQCCQECEGTQTYINGGTMAKYFENVNWKYL